MGTEISNMKGCLTYQRVGLVHPLVSGWPAGVLCKPTMQVARAWRQFPVVVSTRQFHMLEGKN